MRPDNGGRGRLGAESRQRLERRGQSLTAGEASRVLSLGIFWGRSNDWHLLITFCVPHPMRISFHSIPTAPWRGWDSEVMPSPRWETEARGPDPAALERPRIEPRLTSALSHCAVLLWGSGLHPKGPCPCQEHPCPTVRGLAKSQGRKAVSGQRRAGVEATGMNSNPGGPSLDGIGRGRAAVPKARHTVGAQEMVVLTLLPLFSLSVLLSLVLSLRWPGRNRGWPSELSRRGPALHRGSLGSRSPEPPAERAAGAPSLVSHI